MFWIPTLLLGVTFAATPPAAKNVKVSPVSIEDIRVKEFIEGSSSRWERCTLVLRFQGEPVKNATSVGNLTFEKVTDDKGADLKPKKRDYQDFESLQSGFLGSRQEEEEEGFRLDFRLKPPARAASKITICKGRLQVMAGGKNKKLTVSNIKEKIGKTVDRPELEKAGLKVKILDPDKAVKAFGMLAGSPAGKTLTVRYQGSTALIEDVDILNGEGESISSMNASRGEGKVKKVSYLLDEPLGEKTQLQLEILSVGGKVVRVPFEVRDIELP